MAVSTTRAGRPRPKGRLPRITRRIRAALLRYRGAVARLVRLRVIRNDGPVAGQFGEWVAAKYLGLDLAESSVEKGHDARKGRRTYQIKSRIVSGAEASTSFDFRRPMHRFDFFVGVLVSPNFKVLAIIRVSYAAVRRHARRNRGRYSLRWTRRSYDARWVKVLYRAEE